MKVICSNKDKCHVDNCVHGVPHERDCMCNVPCLNGVPDYNYREIVEDDTSNCCIPVKEVDDASHA